MSSSVYHHSGMHLVMSEENLSAGSSMRLSLLPRHAAGPYTSSIPSEPLLGTYGVMKPYQLTFIAIGGAISTGLMIGAGNALSKAGPASILITYTVVGGLIYQVLSALGEVASSLPEISTVAGHAARCIDPALGFTLGWIYWFKYLVVVPSQLTAGTLVLTYWVDAVPVNNAIAMTVFLVIIIATNYWGSHGFGQYEFVLSSFKIMVVLGLIILSLVLALGGGPDRDRKGFRYWNDPGAFAGEATDLGRLRAICRTAPSAMFAYLGSELIGINVLRARNPRKAAVHAMKLTSYRILAFNIVAVTLLGMIVPYNTDNVWFTRHGSKRITASAFVMAIQMANVPVLPHIVNACLLLFVVSSANFALCMASRTLYRLSLEQHAPALLSRTDKRGVPIFALGICSSLASLGYLSVSTDSKVLFDYFVNLVTMFGLLIWISILVIHLAFVRARQVQKIPKSALVFQAPGGPYGSCTALGFCVCVFVTRTLDIVHQEPFPGKFDHWTFTTSYLGIPLYIALVLGYKFKTRCRHVRSQEADLNSILTADEDAPLSTGQPSWRNRLPFMWVL